MRRMLRRLTPAMLTIGLVLGMLGCTAHHRRSPSDELLAASREAGVQVRQNQVFSISRGNETYVAAPIAGWEQRPAADLRNGVDFAFAYFATSEPQIPAGYYTLRAFADVARVGTVPARVQVIDRRGRSVGELQAEVEVHSMTVPEEARNQTSFITSLPSDLGRMIAWHRCPNGQCIRIPIFRVQDFNL